MPVSAVLVLRPRRRAIVHAAPGASVYAALLNAMGRADAALAQRVHDDGAPSALAVSALAGPGDRRSGRLALEPARRQWLRVSSLDDGLLDAILEGLRLPGRPPLHLDGVEFDLEAVHARTGEHPAAAREDLDALEAVEPIKGSLCFRFDSPTSLSGHLFPEPRRVFASLAARWAATGRRLDVSTQQELEVLAERWISVARYELATHVFRVGSVPIVGFVGEVEYHLQRGAPAALRRTIATLARAARYSGVGAKVAWGFGQCRLVSSR